MAIWHAFLFAFVVNVFISLLEKQTSRFWQITLTIIFASVVSFMLQLELSIQINKHPYVFAWQIAMAYYVFSIFVGVVVLFIRFKLWRQRIIIYAWFLKLMGDH
jgi:hypothetical protein